MKNEIITLINNDINSLRIYIDSNINSINTRIDNIEAGAINVYDPTTGLYVPIQTAIDNLYETQRTDAITASEFDALELTATEFDAYQITAREFDLQAKSILV